MENRNKLGTVVRFEIMRNLKKPSFWLAAILLPILLIGYVYIMGLNGANTEHAVTDNNDVSELRLGICDDAGITGDTGMEDIATKEQGVESTKAGELNVFYYIPADFTTAATIEIYTMTENTSLFTNYEQPIREALAVAATAHVAPEDVIILSSTYSVDTTNYTATGEEQDSLAKMIVPLAVLALFYVLICMFGNRLTMATVEEKENRITEIILTTLSPTTLIIGKIISLIALGLIQLAVLVIPVLLFYFYGGAQGLLPSDLMIDWSFWGVTGSLLLLVLSYFLFTGFAVAVGAFVPTAKELAPYASVFMLFVILPVMSVSSFMVEPTLFTYALSYFPLTAPVALMLRNAFGTLPPHELILGLINLAVFSAVAIALAVYIFKRSAMDLNSKLSFKRLLPARKKK